jgi:hypothetical protein
MSHVRPFSEMMPLTEGETLLFAAKLKKGDDVEIWFTNQPIAKKPQWGCWVGRVEEDDPREGLGIVYHTGHELSDEDKAQQYDFPYKGIHYASGCKVIPRPPEEAHVVIMKGRKKAGGNKGEEGARDDPQGEIERMLTVELQQGSQRNKSYLG